MRMREGGRKEWAEAERLLTVDSPIPTTQRKRILINLNALSLSFLQSQPLIFRSMLGLPHYHRHVLQDQRSDFSPALSPLGRVPPHLRQAIPSPPQLPPDQASRRPRLPPPQSRRGSSLLRLRPLRTFPPLRMRHLRRRLLPLLRRRSPLPRRRSRRLNAARPPDRRRRRPCRTLLLRVPRPGLRSRLRRRRRDRSDCCVNSRRRSSAADPVAATRESSKEAPCGLLALGAGSARTRSDRKLLWPDCRGWNRSRSFAGFAARITRIEQFGKHVLHELGVASAASHAAVAELLLER